MICDDSKAKVQKLFALAGIDPSDGIKSLSFSGSGVSEALEIAHSAALAIEETGYDSITVHLHHPMCLDTLETLLLNHINDANIKLIPISPNEDCLCDLPISDEIMFQLILYKNDGEYVYDIKEQSVSLFHDSCVDDRFEAFILGWVQAVAITINQSCNDIEYYMPSDFAFPDVMELKTPVTPDEFCQHFLTSSRMGKLI